MNWPDQSETVILCEGYHDRAFWKGLLPSVGCNDLFEHAANKRQQIIDPWKTQVKNGEYAFASKTNGFIRVRPCHGITNVLPAMKLRLAESDVKTLRSLIVNIDSDLYADGSPHEGSPLSRQQLENAIRERDPHFVHDGHGGYLAYDTTVHIHSIVWDAHDPHSSTLPKKQTLERLVCASINAIYPHRGAAIDQWLQSRKDAPYPGPKEHALSHIAGWYADSGVEAFYLKLWQDPAIVRELIARLTPSGTWRIVQQIAG